MSFLSTFNSWISFFILSSIESLEPSILIAEKGPSFVKSLNVNSFEKNSG